MIIWYIKVMYSGQPGYSGTDPYALNRGIYQSNMSWSPMGYYTYANRDKPKGPGGMGIPQGMPPGAAGMSQPMPDPIGALQT